jgi:cytoskeleton protein RodZ
VSAMPWDTDHNTEHNTGHTHTDAESTGDSGSVTSDDAVVAGSPVVIRRHAGVAALIGATASTVAIAYLWRASQTMTVLDWALCALMAVIAAVHLSSLVDARTPLLVADDLGVRIRLGHEWRGLPWEAVGRVVVHPRRGLLRDGRLVFAPRSLARALDGLDAKARHQAALNQKMYGAALAVPLGLTTRISKGDLGLAEELRALSHGRAEVVEVAPSVDPEPESADTAPPTAQAPVAQTDGRPEDEPAAAGHVGHAVAEADPSVDGETASDHAPVEGADDQTTAQVRDTEADEPAYRAARRSILGGIGTIVSRVAKGREHDVDAPAAEGDPAPAVPAAAAPSAVPLRETRSGQRAEVTRDLPASLGNTALQPSPPETELPEGRELRRPGSVDLVFERVTVDDRVRPISTLGDPVAPLVIDDFVTEPAYDPVIGPELAAARTRLGLSVDELADRTRIRPHVIESIEVDDFAPCGGDFYARGHLRTLARVLGKDVTPLLESFEERYATAPINARRVFEAELATGMTGSMRSTVGGPSWGLLIGVVLTLVLVWGVVRLFTTDPAEVMEVPAPILENSARVDSGYPVAPDLAPAVEPVRLLLTASQADSEVVVRDGDGMVVYSGELVLGERKTLQVSPPVRVRAADGGAVEATVDGKARGPLGVAGEPVRRTFR